MEDILQVAFLTVGCLLAGGLGSILIIAVSIFAGRKAG